MPRLMRPSGSSLWRKGARLVPAACENSGGATVGPAVDSVRWCEVVSSYVALPCVHYPVC